MSEGRASQVWGFGFSGLLRGPWQESQQTWESGFKRVSRVSRMLRSCRPEGFRV